MSPPWAALLAAVLAATAVLLRPRRPGRARLHRLLGPVVPRRGRDRLRRSRFGAGRRGGADDPPVPFLVDLVAAAVSAGLPPRAACRAVGLALDPGRGADPDRDEAAGPGMSSELAAALLRLGDGLPAGHRGLAGLERVLDRSLRLGLAPAALLHRAAAAERRAVRARAAAATGRLPVRLVLPAGLCLLPAALLLGVVPVVLDLVGDLLG